MARCLMHHALNGVTSFTKQCNNVLLAPYFSLVSESVQPPEQLHEMLLTHLFNLRVLWNVCILPSVGLVRLINGLPNLVACHIPPCYSSSQQIPTVREILNEWLQLLQNNLEEFCMRTSEQSLVINNSKSGRCDHEELEGYGQLQLEPFIYCSHQEYFPLISPLILTGQSQQSAESFHMQEASTTSNKTQLTQPCVSLTGWF